MIDDVLPLLTEKLQKYVGPSVSLKLLQDGHTVLQTNQTVEFIEEFESSSGSSVAGIVSVLGELRDKNKERNDEIADLKVKDKN